MYKLVLSNEIEIIKKCRPQQELEKEATKNRRSEAEAEKNPERLPSRPKL